ncbi:lipoprotein, partial [Candidatus Magnetomorum sp. HK-1]
NDGFMIDNFFLTGPPSGKADLWVSNQKLFVSASKGVSQINIENIGDKTMQWQIENTLNWISTQPLLGHNDGIITINYTENEDQQRSGCFTISATDALNSVQSICLVQNEPDAAPIISRINNVIIDKNSDGKNISFTVTDNVTPTNQLNLWAESNNPTLIPNDYDHLAIGGPVDQRNLLIVPATDQTGVALITIYVKDTDGFMGLRTFTVSVQYVFPLHLDINNDAKVDLMDLIISLQIISKNKVNNLNSEIKIDISTILQIFKSVWTTF